MPSTTFHDKFNTLINSIKGKTTASFKLPKPIKLEVTKEDAKKSEVVEKTLETAIKIERKKKI